MTTLAQRIMQVLHHHHLEHTQYTCEQQGCFAFAGAMSRGRLDLIQRDLLALYPQPSKEALENLLRSWQTKDSISVGFPSGTIKIDTALLDALASWATGEAEQPRVVAPPTAADIADAAIHSTDRMVRHQMCLACRHCIGCPVCAAQLPSAG